ncbi:MAG: FAD-binding oxidoreductase [Anaerolineae bacterium]|nr:FAD-binding oxidoreductase [Anaerolineae bacterium]
METIEKNNIQNQTWSELAKICGAENVLTDAEALELHSYDVWPVAAKLKMQGKQPYRPDVVVRPLSTRQVSETLAWASREKITVTPWGLGSSVTGAPLPLHGGISLDMSAMKRILALDVTNLIVRVQAGKLGIELEQDLNKRGFTLNHSPQSLDRSSVGGWVSTRATGQFSSRWGGIEEMLVALSAVLPTGEVIETTLAPRAAVGPDLNHLFMGAEGTMGVITEVVLKIFPVAEQRLFQALAFPNIEKGLVAMRRIMQSGLRPFLVRFYDSDEARHAMVDPTFNGPVMFLGFEGIKQVAEAEYAAGLEICLQEGGRELGPAAVLAWMNRRFDFSSIENRLALPGGLAETIEIAHFWGDIAETYQALKTALAPYAAEVLGHFSHVYPQGVSLYIILMGQERDDATAEERILKIWETSMNICLEKGAVISHHHGVGIARLPYMRAQSGSAKLALEKIKAAVDPAGIMNPGKLGLNS